MPMRRATRRLPQPVLIILAAAGALRAESRHGAEPPNHAQSGYVLFAPLLSTTTYLVDLRGALVHSWKSEFTPGQAVYLLENGHLLRCACERSNHTFHGGGLGGRLQEFDWDGHLEWEFVYADNRHMQHHDVEPMPNGNVLILAWERKTGAEAVAAGRDPARVGFAGLWPDHVVEVKREGPHGGTIVWEWHVWDHLIQDHDASKANYGSVAEHPELIDVNFGGEPMRMSREQRQRLESLGYIQRSAPPRPPGAHPDWNHTNAIAYNPKLDQISLSVLSFNEIWIIDHSTTTAQAAGHTGGRSGKGGDLLYRWGNPRAYRTGTAADQRLFGQHDVRWIPEALPGAGHLTVFNNGRGRPDGDYSSVDEIAPPVDADGHYHRDPGCAFGPAKPIWSYTSPQKTDFFAGHISGAQRLPNGNTLICSGERGRIFVVDPNGAKVWEYVNPFGGEVKPPRAPGGPPGRLGAPPEGPLARPPGGPPFPPPRGFFGGPPPGPGHGPPGGGDQPNAVFLATWIAPDFAGLAGRELKVLEKPKPPVRP